MAELRDPVVTETYVDTTRTYANPTYTTPVNNGVVGSYVEPADHSHHILRWLLWAALALILLHLLWNVFTHFRLEEQLRRVENTVNTVHYSVVQNR